MSAMKSMERKAQQQTLSIRVSDSLREYLERAKEVMSSSRGDGVSTSEVAKMLLESAREDRLDHRFEVANLQRNAAESLWSIRQKWEQQLGLSHAEWLFLARYVQVGCEEVVEDPRCPKPESFAQVLEAFLAVRALRLDRGVALDKYYLGNLAPTNEPPLNDRQLDAEMVPNMTTKLIQALRHSGSPSRPAFAGRNLFVALRDETLPEIAAINDAISHNLPTLFRMAARGHWLAERKPIRTPGRTSTSVCRTFPPLCSGDQRLSVLVTIGGEVEILLELDGKGVTYPLNRYPLVREFAAMFALLESGRNWRGREFFGYTNGCDVGCASRYCFRIRRNDIVVSFTRQEWQSLRDLFEKTLAIPELRQTLEELSLVYGEI
jgi:hypothetical protein